LLASHGEGQRKQTKLAHETTLCQIGIAPAAVSTLHLVYVSSVLWGTLVPESDWS
jgi:hypothetical protein